MGMPLFILKTSKSSFIYKKNKKTGQYFSESCTRKLLFMRIADNTRHAYLPPATKLGQGYIFTGVCDSVHAGASSRGCLVETPRDGYCCGRYASYWNAFLFHTCSLKLVVCTAPLAHDHLIWPLGHLLCHSTGHLSLNRCTFPWVLGPGF